MHQESTRTTYPSHIHWIISTTVKCIKINISGIYQSLRHCIISITVKCIKNQDQPNTLPLLVYFHHSQEYQDQYIRYLSVTSHCIISITVKCIKINRSGIHQSLIHWIISITAKYINISGFYQSLRHCIISITVKCIKNQDQPNTQATGLFSSQSSYHYQPSSK